MTPSISVNPNIVKRKNRYKYLDRIIALTDIIIGMARTRRPPADTPFAKWLAECMSKYGIDMITLSKESGVSQSQISGYWDGSARPRPESIEKMARAFVPLGIGSVASEALFEELNVRGVEAAFLADKITSEPVFDYATQAAYRNLPPEDQSFVQKFITEKARLREIGEKEPPQEDDGKDYED